MTSLLFLTSSLFAQAWGADPVPQSPPANQPPPPAQQAPAPGIEGAQTLPPQAGASSDPSSDSLLKMRDPFKKPESLVEESRPVSDLEAFASHQYQLAGVVTGPKQVRALVIAPNGKAFYVAKGARIGRRGGVIEKIMVDKIVIQEKIVNVLGQAENITTELRLAAQSRGGLSLNMGPESEGGSKPGAKSSPGQPPSR